MKDDYANLSHAGLKKALLTVNLDHNMNCNSHVPPTLPLPVHKVYSINLLGTISP